MPGQPGPWVVYGLRQRSLGWGSGGSCLEPGPRVMVVYLCRHLKTPCLQGTGDRNSLLVYEEALGPRKVTCHCFSSPPFIVTPLPSLIFMTTVLGETHRRCFSLSSCPTIGFSSAPRLSQWGHRHWDRSRANKMFPLPGPRISDQ